MSGGFVFTCPDCRSIVEYSCRCEVEPPFERLVGHDSVEEAKAHVALMNADPQAAYDDLMDMIGVCGYGNPSAAMQLVKDALTQGDPWGIDHPVRPVNHAQAELLIKDNTEGAAWLLLYLLHNRDLTKHGGNVGDSWLTPLGKEAVKVLERGNGDDEAAA